MGCWGINALQSDDGLDVLSELRPKLSPDGRNRLEDWVQVLKGVKEVCPPPVETATSHNSFMALAEIAVRCLDRELSGLDLTDDAAGFSDIISLTASKLALRELRDYVTGTLTASRGRAEKVDGQGQYSRKWDGWFKEENWIGWQRYTEGLIARLDSLLVQPGDEVVLFEIEQQLDMSQTEGAGPTMGSAPSVC